MFRHVRNAFPLLALLAPLPIHAFGADSEEEVDAVAAHRHFDAVEPYLNEPSKSVEKAIAEHCLTLDRRCVAFSDMHGDVVLSGVPDNPEFWAVYDSLLAADSLPVERIESGNLPAYQGFIEGTKGWLRRELVTRRLTDAQRLHSQVMAHRRRLGLSNILIEKMIFAATTGILLPAINVYMAHDDVRGIDPEQRLLDEMLHPMTPDELSLRRVMDGELRYAAARLEQLAEEDSPVRLTDLQRVSQFVANRSEADWEDFWRYGLDIPANVELPWSVSQLYIPSWADYAVPVRYLEASLYVLRALREMYEGRISTGPPASQAPYGWSWRWEEESQTMCLDRGYVHRSVSADDPVSICYPYLDSRPHAR